MATMEIQKASSTELAFGNYQDVEILAKRIKTMCKGGDKLKVEEAMALAQVATVTRLDPFIGEIWYIPGSGPMVGIAGARRLDQELATKRGGYSFPVVTPCSPEEAGATEVELKDVVAAFKVEINDSGATGEYQKLFVSTIQAMREAGAQDPFAAAKEICGPRPSWVGYGYSKKGEQSRMNKTQLARKRGEADALKKRIVIPFGATIAESDVAPEYVEAQVSDVTEKRSIAQNMKELGFSDEEKHSEIGIGNLDKDPPESKALPRMTYDEAKQVIVKTSKGELFVGQMCKDQLDAVIEKSIIPATVEAARIVLEHDFNMTEQDKLL